MPNDWQIQRNMSPRQYAHAIATLGLNKAQAGRYLGISERTSHRYWDGDAVVPEAFALLLRALIAHGEMPLVPKAPKWRKGRTDA